MRSGPPLLPRRSHQRAPLLIQRALDSASRAVPVTVRNNARFHVSGQSDRVSRRDFVPGQLSGSADTDSAGARCGTAPICQGCLAGAAVRACQGSHKAPPDPETCVESWEPDGVAPLHDRPALFSGPAR